MSFQVLEGDCVEVMRGMDAASVDAVVTDPPYGLEFMGKEWDKLEPARTTQRWAGSERKLIGDGSGQGGDFGERMGEMPSYRPKRNAKCRKCGHYRFSGSPCQCDTPDWDHRANEHAHSMQAWHEAWAREALRVLKPGGHLLAFGGTRTYHRLACAIEDAGFEIRDTVQWIYGSGFPKSLNVGKAIDKMAGAEREVVGFNPIAYADSETWGIPNSNSNATKGKTNAYGEINGNVEHGSRPVTAPATEAAQEWDGWGTALKPAHEPIVLARKPLAESSIARQVLATGTGALNVDGCRVGHNGANDLATSQAKNPGRTDMVTSGVYGKDRPQQSVNTAGRFPANLLLSHHPDCVRVGEWRVKGGTAARKNGISTNGAFSNGYPEPDKDLGYTDDSGMETVEAYECAPGCPVGVLDGQSGNAGGRWGKPHAGHSDGYHGGLNRAEEAQARRVGDTEGGASRFFQRFDAEPGFTYVPKASRRERNAGLEGRFDLFEQSEAMPETRKAQLAGAMKDGQLDDVSARYLSKPMSNSHPTVKPIALMRYLCRLITPPGGTVLDPFTGSGSTGCAAILEGFDFVGIEKEAEYAEIARRRIAHHSGDASEPVELLATLF